MNTVVHIVDGDAMGGTERVALDLLLSLDRQRWRPVLCHHDAPGLAPFVAEANAGGVVTRVVPRLETVRDLGRLPELVRAFRSERPAVLHAHLSWPLSCKYALLASSIARVPVVVATAHLVTGMAPTLLTAIQPRLMARMVDRYIAVSAFVAQRLEHDLRIPREKVEVVRNGIDLTRFAHPRDERLRASLTGDRDRPVVLTVARLEHQKGLRHLIDAAVDVPEAVFVVAGEGTEAKMLHDLARSNGVLDRMRFLGRRDDVPALLACADVFVLPSLNEGLPLAVMEAQVAGVPVVATTAGGTGELVTEGETGLLVPPADGRALAGAIRTLLSDRMLAQRMVAAARVRAQRDCDRNRVALRVATMYDELLARVS